MPRTGYCTNECGGDAADARAAAFIGWMQDAIPHSGWG
jgi:hypothetical protein